MPQYCFHSWRIYRSVSSSIAQHKDQYQLFQYPVRDCVSVNSIASPREQIGARVQELANSVQGGGRADAEEEGRVGGISRGARDGIVRFVFPRHG